MLDCAETKSVAVLFVRAVSYDFIAQYFRRLDELGVQSELSESSLQENETEGENAWNSQYDQRCYKFWIKRPRRIADSTRVFLQTQKSVLA